MSTDGTMLFAAGADGAVVALAFDVERELGPLLSPGRLWDPPADGRFRMESRLVDIRYVAHDAGVVEWVLASSAQDDRLIVTVLDMSGNTLTTEMGRVVLAQTARAALPAAGEYRVRLERTYSDREAVITMSSEVVQ
jgi:hypothetical protein